MGWSARLAGLPAEHVLLKRHPHAVLNKSPRAGFRQHDDERPAAAALGGADAVQVVRRKGAKPRGAVANALHQRAGCGMNSRVKGFPRKEEVEHILPIPAPTAR